MIRNKRNKLKYLDRSNANEIMAKILWKYFLIYFSLQRKIPKNERASIEGKSPLKWKYRMCCQSFL